MLALRSDLNILYSYIYKHLNYMYMFVVTSYKTRLNAETY